MYKKCEIYTNRKCTKIECKRLVLYICVYSIIVYKIQNNSVEMTMKQKWAEVG